MGARTPRNLGVWSRALLIRGTLRASSLRHIKRVIPIVNGTKLLRFAAPRTQASLDTVVSLIGRMNEKVKHAMEELAALGGVRPRLLADDTIELRPAPASPELSQKVAEIFERAGVRELRPWVWGFAEANRMTLAARAKASDVACVPAVRELLQQCVGESKLFSAPAPQGRRWRRPG
jgi:hypothetical protein